ncbi:MAG: sigma-70 family RNA polymerase sigma factor [Actinomycetota bacterium]|nr:sigma-70 family RNA polymerase sigma factor [Actinomycetota bacterium]
MALRARADNTAVDHSVTPHAPGAPDVDFGDLWAYHGDVRALCRRIVGDDAAADDVLQDTFVRALANAERLDRRVSFAPWLATVARRRSIDQLRSDGRVQPVAAVPESMATSVDGDPVEHLLQQERVGRVREALAALAPRERQLLMRQVAHGLSLAELAAEEDATVASVRSLLSRARTKLRVALERGGPLGVAPAPGLVVAAKRRFHRLAVRLEGSMPMLAGGGAQFGDVVMAAVAAVAMLIAGNVPPTEAPSQFLTALAGSEQSNLYSSASHGSGGRDRAAEADTASAVASAAPTITTATATTIPPRTWSPLATPGQGLDVPTIPDGRTTQPESAYIESFAASDDGVVFAEGQSGGSVLYRSNDGGTTWQHPDSAGFTGSRLLVPPSYTANPTIFEVPSSNGPLLRSDDGGDNFWPITAPRGAATFFPASGASSADLLLATPHLLRYHTDEGTSAPVGMGPPIGAYSVAVPLDYGTSGVVLVGSMRNSVSFPKTDTPLVYRCIQLSCTQTVLSSGGNAPTVHVSKSVPGLVLAYNAGYLERSTDHGATFSPVTLPAGVRIEDIADGDTGELLLGSIGVPGTGTGLYRSTDGGQTWSVVTTGTVLDGGVAAVIRLSTGETIASPTGAKGLYCSDDGGATWATRCP